MLAHVLVGSLHNDPVVHQLRSGESDRPAACLRSRQPARRLTSREQNAQPVRSIGMAVAFLLYVVVEVAAVIKVPCEK